MNLTIPNEIENYINTIELQLRWLIDQSNDKKVLPNTPIGNELWQRFFLLYKDLKSIQSQIEAQILLENDEGVRKLISLLERTNTGIFYQFSQLVETGNVPSKTD